MNATAPARPRSMASLLGTEVFAVAAVAMIALSDAGEIVDANEAAADLLGIAPSGLRQEPISRFLPSLAEAPLRNHVVSARRSDSTVTIGPLWIRGAGRGETEAVALLRALRDGVRWPILLLQLLPYGPTFGVTHHVGGV